MKFPTTNLILVVVSLGLLLCGCEKSPEPQFRLNAVEKLSSELMTLADGEQFSDEHVQQMGSILTALFGTPDQPDFPFPFGEEDPSHEILSLENLEIAAGPVTRDSDGNHRGLYRQHCAHCHGITGDGAGPTARSLNPYPRDFRLAKFKYKSTPLGKRPTDSDLTRVLVNGVPGSAMPSFRHLPEEQITALVDYVKYLSIRGEVERQLLNKISKLDKDEKLLDLSLAEDEDTLEDFEDQFWELLNTEDSPSVLAAVIPKWLKRDKYVTKPPPAPASLNPTHPDHSQFVARGRELFRGSGGCVQCHGDTGLGDGQTESFDDWHKWAKDAKVDPDDEATYAPFVAKGALPPRYIRPRNLNLKTFRGGNHPDDLYRRIVNGIEGTPMPSAAVLEKSPDDIWAIVAFVKSLPYESGNVEPPKPVNEKPIH